MSMCKGILRRSKIAFAASSQSNPKSQYPNRSKNEPERGASQTVCGTCHSDRTRFFRFSEKKPGYRDKRTEGRANSRRVSRCQSQSSQRAHRLCGVAGTRETPEVIAGLCARGREIRSSAGTDRTCRSSASENSRDWDEPTKSGTGGVCRCRKENRFNQIGH